MGRILAQALQLRKGATAGARNAGHGNVTSAAAVPYAAGMYIRSVGALGANFTISTPFGNQTIGIPVEQMATTAVNAAWPTFQSKIQAALPGLLKQAMPAVQAQEAAVVSQVNRTVFLLGATLVGAIGLAVWAIRRK